MAILITFFMTLFWGFHELSGSVITLFASRNVALDGFMTAAQTNSLNSMFIIILAIPISLLWGYLSKKNLNPRTPYKFGLGLVLAGASFYILALSEGSADENGMVPFAYLIVMYFVLVHWRIIYVSSWVVKNHEFISKTHRSIYDGNLVLVFCLCFSNCRFYWQTISSRKYRFKCWRFRYFSNLHRWLHANFTVRFRCWINSYYFFSINEKTNGRRTLKNSCL